MINPELPEDFILVEGSILNAIKRAKSNWENSGS